MRRVILGVSLSICTIGMTCGAVVAGAGPAAADPPSIAFMIFNPIVLPQSGDTPLGYGETVEFGAFVSLAPDLGGTMTFYANGSGTPIPGCVDVPLTNEVNSIENEPGPGAECTVDHLEPVGTFALTATWSGDSKWPTPVTGTLPVPVVPAPTATVATPAVVRIVAPRLFLWTFHATLSTVFYQLEEPVPEDVAVAGKLITFSANGTTLCQATTDADGFATCSALNLTSVLATLLADGYQATFGGDADYVQSAQTAGLVG